MSNRRLRGFVITGELLGAFVCSGEWQIKVVSSIPGSAKFYKADFDWQRNCFVAYFQDESFDDVEEGCAIPIQRLEYCIRNPFS